MTAPSKSAPYAVVSAGVTGRRKRRRPSPLTIAVLAAARRRRGAGREGREPRRRRRERRPHGVRGRRVRRRVVEADELPASVVREAVGTDIRRQEIEDTGARLRAEHVADRVDVDSHVAVRRRDHRARVRRAATRRKKASSSSSCPAAARTPCRARSSPGRRNRRFQRRRRPSASQGRSITAAPPEMRPEQPLIMTGEDDGAAGLLPRRSSQLPDSDEVALPVTMESSPAVGGSNPPRTIRVGPSPFPSSTRPQ